MNLILLFEDDFVDATRRHVRLGDRHARHVRKVLRAGVGDTVVVGLCDGPVGQGRITRLDRERVELEVSLDAAPPAPLDVTLVLALPRPPVLRRTLAQVASLGVKRIALIDSERVEQSFWQSHVTASDAIEAQLMLGLEQARDTRRPEVTLHRRFGAFASERLPELAAGRTGFVADPGGDPGPEGRWPAPALVAIGPEGGWVARELDAFAQAGLRTVVLGQRALRVETAVPVVLGRYL